MPTTPVSTIIQKTTQPIYKRFGFSDQRILTEWPSIIGDTLSALCQPVRISHTQGGILHIEVYHTGIVTELQHLEPAILDKIAIYFGFRLVNRIKLHHKPLSLEHIRQRREKKADTPSSPSPQSPVPDSVKTITSTITDDALKAALERLGTSINHNDG